MALYLKYRPQSLNELVGQTQVKQALNGAFQSGKLSHAYLFVGPRGTGKTSTARILAKMVNCEGKGESGKGEVPCNKCQTCISITDGSNLDLIEIDAASNRGIDDIRALRERIKLSPTASKKKIYIIDEVHMLTTEAFNALLKTLEEPPAHALFILATTEVQKIPQTIMSRVTRLDFKLAKPEELRQALERIISDEKLEIEEEALKLIVKKAEGSFRDGVKLLDQIASTSTKITLQNTRDSLRTGQFEETLSFMQSISGKDITNSLKLILAQVEKGTDVKDFALQIMDMCRNFVFIKNGLGSVMVAPNYMEEIYKEMAGLSEKFSNKDLVKILDILQSAIEQLKFASIPSLPLELAVIEICNTLPIIANEVKQSSPEVIQTKIASSLEAPRNDNVVVLNEMKDLKIEPADSSPIYPEQSQKVQNDNSSDILKLKEKWTFVLETVRQYNFSLEALLRQVSVKECTVASVIMEVPYAFHQRILESPKNRDLVESLFIDILGRNVRISIVLSERPKRMDDIANVDVAADDDIIRAAAEIFSSDTVN